jgi:hypothetical protein
MLIIVIAAAATRGGDNPPSPVVAPNNHPVETPAAPPPGPGSGAATTEVPSAGSATAPSETGSGSGSGSSDVAIGDDQPSVVTHPATNETTTGHRPHGDKSNGDKSNSEKPNVERPNVDALYKQGLQAFVKGDQNAALGLLQKAKAANPSFAPTWRVLGQVHEKLGNHGSAKTAFQRYLQLAPNAPDTEQIKARLEHL